MGQKKFQLVETQLINFITIGITSNDNKDYKFAYYLNQKLGFVLKRINNLDYIIKGKQYDYINYESYNSYLDSSIFLLKNTPVSTIYSTVNSSNALIDLFSFAPLLIPELKNCNYILKIDDNQDSIDLIKKLKELNQIQFIHPINKNKIKSIKKLIF